MPSKKSKKPMLDFPTPVKTVTNQVELEEPTNALIDKYCDFLEKVKGNRPTRDWVINGALKRLFSKDGAFKEFLGHKGR